MSSSPLSSIAEDKMLLICLSNFPRVCEIYKAYWTLIYYDNNMMRTSSAEVAAHLLRNEEPERVLIFGADLLNERQRYIALIEELVAYTKEGGITIFTAIPGTEILKDEAAKFFSEAFQLNWKIGGIVGFATYKLNPKSRLSDYGDLRFEITGTCLTNVEKAKDVIVIPCIDEDLVEPVEDGSELPKPVPTEGPVILTRFHRGRLGWFGDLDIVRYGTQELLGLMYRSYPDTRQLSTVTLGRGSLSSNLPPIA